MINIYYIPTYTQISSVNVYEITPEYFVVNTPSSVSLKVVLGVCVYSAEYIYTPNQERHKQPLLPRFYHNKIFLHLFRKFNNS
jgi:hypothetical protein